MKHINDWLGRHGYQLSSVLVSLIAVGALSMAVQSMYLPVANIPNDCAGLHTLPDHCSYSDF